MSLITDLVIIALHVKIVVVKIRALFVGKHTLRIQVCWETYFENLSLSFETVFLLMYYWLKAIFKAILVLKQRYEKILHRNGVNCFVIV